MNIQWYGQACFRIQSKDTVIFTDPYAKKIGLRPPRTRADIVTVSHEHFDHDNVECLKDNPFIIKTPGEFEIKKVFIKGIMSFHDKSKGQKRGPNTIYTINVENINGPILLLTGKEDKMWPATQMCEMIVKRLKKNNFPHWYKHVAYENAGHALHEKGIMGGTKEGNKKARIDSEQRRFAFLSRLSEKQ